MRGEFPADGRITNTLHFSGTAVASGVESISNREAVRLSTRYNVYGNPQSSMHLVMMLSGWFLFLMISAATTADLGAISDLLIVVGCAPIALVVCFKRITIGSLSPVLVILALLAVTYLISGAAGQYMEGVRQAGLIFIGAIVMIWFYHLHRTCQRTTMFLVLGLIALLLLFAAYIFRGEAVAKNVYGSAALYLILFCAVARAKYVGLRRYVVIWSFLSICGVAYVVDQRQLYGLAGLLVFVYMVTCSKGFRASRVVLLVTGVVAVNVMIFVALSGWAFGGALESLSAMNQSSGARTIYSGRELIWPMVAALIGRQPLTGYGPTAVPGDFLDIELSAHNLFLQVGLQVGLVGSALIFLFFFGAYLQVARSATYVSLPTRPQAAIAFGVISVALMHSCFEVVLFQNIVPVGMLSMAVLGGALGHCDREWPGRLNPVRRRSVRLYWGVPEDGNP